MPAVTRLAPSPTGALHLGNARTFALTWWWARRHGARLVLRIEDLDSPRKKLQAIDEALRDLAWLGLDADTAPIIQSTRHEQHLQALARLQAQGLVYACTCRRRDIEEAQDAPQEGADLHYPGTCRDRYASLEEAHAEVRRPIAVRIRLPAEPVTIEDLRFGAVTIDPSRHGGDFILTRFEPERGHAIGYQLGVVVDDGIDGTTMVIRGDDLLTSAPRQRLLQRWLDLPPCTYLHLPLVVGEDGRRLAKRHGDTRIAAYREAGIPAAALRAWIAETSNLPLDWWEHPERGDERAVIATPGPIVVPAHDPKDGAPKVVPTGSVRGLGPRF